MNLLETPKTRKVYIINGEEFTRKSDIIARARQLFGEWKPQRLALEGEARDFFLCLLHHHPGWKQKTQKRPDDEIELRPEYMAGSYGLRIYHRDSGFRGDDISWRHAVGFIQKEIMY